MPVDHVGAILKYLADHPDLNLSAAEISKMLNLDKIESLNLIDHIRSEFPWFMKVKKVLVVDAQFREELVEYVSMNDL